MCVNLMCDLESEGQAVERGHKCTCAWKVQEEKKEHPLGNMCVGAGHNSELPTASWWVRGQISECSLDN